MGLHKVCGHSSRTLRRAAVLWVDFTTPSQKCRAITSGDASALRMRPSTRGRIAKAKVLTQHGRAGSMIRKRVAQAQAKNTLRAVQKTSLQGRATKPVKQTQGPHAPRSKATGCMTRGISARGKCPARGKSKEKLCVSASKAAGLSERRRRAGASQVVTAATPLRKRARLART